MIVILPPIILFFIFVFAGINAITKKTSLTAIEIQNKYRKKRRNPPMNDTDIQELYIKHCIVGGVLILGVALNLIFSIFLLL